MQYRSDRYGNKISALGYGCMRFTQSSGKVDVAKAEKEIMEAYRGGVIHDSGQLLRYLAQP